MLEQAVLTILEQHLSSITARTLLRRCTTAAGLRPEELQHRHLPDLVRRLEVGVRLFAEPDEQRSILARIAGLGAAPVGPTTFPIRAESDVATARRSARALALQLGATSFAAQKIATIVSELARNIVLYAESGTIEIAPAKPTSRSVEIVASDRGPGIADLDHVLSGNYKSKTGLGRGLLSLRRMARAFEVDTSQRGTVIRLELEL